MQSVSAIILNYNGLRHLTHLMPTIRKAAQRVPVPCSVVVLDNGSNQGDVEWLREHFPEVEIAIAPENAFLFSYNWLIRQRAEDIVVLLNNDLRVSPDFLEPLLRHFHHKDVFAVSATSMDWEGTRYTCGPARLRAHHGMYHWDYERERQVLAHTLFASGGFMAVDREKFVLLGGFNRLFYPAYGEDLDLCFRAWRRGWRCLFDPDSIVYHRENGSFSEVGKGRAQRLVDRCRCLFQWSSLPPAAGWMERSAIHLLTAWRKVVSADFGWAARWMKTWLEWQRLRSSYRWMKVSPEELGIIVRRIEMPPPGQLRSGVAHPMAPSHDDLQGS